MFFMSAVATKENAQRANCAPTPVRAQLSESSAVAQIIERLEALSRIDERTAGWQTRSARCRPTRRPTARCCRRCASALVEFEHSLEDVSGTMREVQQNQISPADHQLLQKLRRGLNINFPTSLKEFADAVPGMDAVPDEDREAVLGLGALVALSAAAVAWRRSRGLLRRRCPSARSLLLLQALAGVALITCGASDKLRSLPLVGHRYAPDDASVRRYRQLSTVCLFASTWALPLKLVVGSDRR